MNFEKAKKLLTQLSVFYFLLAAMIFFVAGDGFRHEIVNGSALSPSSVIGEIVDGMVVEQRLPLGADHVEALNLQVATFGRQNTGILHVDIYGEDGTLISSAQGRLEDMGDNQVIRFSFAESLDGMRKQYSTVKIWSRQRNNRLLRKRHSGGKVYASEGHCIRRSVSGGWHFGQWNSVCIF